MAKIRVGINGFGRIGRNVLRACLSDETWAALGARYDVQTLMDLVVTVGQYHLMAMAMRSFGIRLEPGFTGFPSTVAGRALAPDRRPED